MRALIEGIHYFKTQTEETIKIAADYLKTRDFDAVGYSWQVHAERLFLRALSVGKRDAIGHQRSSHPEPARTEPCARAFF